MSKSSRRKMLLGAIKNMNEYNPSYSKAGKLLWNEISEYRPKIKFDTISIDKLKTYKYSIDPEILRLSLEQYMRTNELIPIQMRLYDNLVQSGHEQLILAETLGITEIPYIGCYDGSINHMPYREKIFVITDCEGNQIYVNPDQYKRIKECIVMCKKLGLRMEILPIFRFRIYNIKTGRQIKCTGGEETKLTYLYKFLNIMLAN